MKINQLAAKPQLIKITLDAKEILEKHGEAVEFWTWDRQPLDVFMKLANLQSGEAGEIINVVKNLILDEQGKPVITGDVVLPTDILVAAIGEITTMLGK